MRKQYLHLSAYICSNCSGPVIAGWLALRENEISGETGIEQVGAVCLACGRRQNVDTGLNRVREFSPIEWVSRSTAGSNCATTSLAESDRAA